MQLIQINIVRSEPFETILGSPTNVRRLGSLLAFINSHPKFRRDDHVRSSRAQSAAKILLAEGFPINVSRIEEIDAIGNRRIDNRFRGCFIDSPTKIVATKSNDRNIQRSNLTC